MPNLVQHLKIFMILAFGFSATCLFFIYVAGDPTTIYQIFQQYSNRTNIFWNSDKCTNEAVSNSRMDLNQTNPFTEILNNPLYQSNRGIRVLRKNALRNIIVEDDDDCQNRNFLVYKCSKGLCGGWGDREKGIVSSFLLALLTNRTFIIYMDKPCALEKFIEPFIYNWTKCKSFVDKTPASNTLEKSYIGGNRNFYDDIANTNFEKVWTKQKIVLHMNAYNPVMTGIKLHNHAEMQMKWIINMTNPEIVHTVMNTLFIPKQRMKGELIDFFQNNRRGRHLVCSHIRMGKNPSNPGDNFLPKGTPNVTTIFSHLKRFKNPQKYAIYIATDSDDVRQEAMNKFQNVFNINRTIVHVDRYKQGKDPENVCEGFYTVVFEQQMLSLCDTILITRSNFGTIAAYMRGSSEDLFLYHTKQNRVFKTNLTNIQTFYGFI